jgi:hypothetical protein
MEQEVNRERQSLMTVRELAADLGMSYQWAKTQRAIPYVRIGRRKLFKPSDVRAYIERNTRGIV